MGKTTWIVYYVCSIRPWRQISISLEWSRIPSTALDWANPKQLSGCLISFFMPKYHTLNHNSLNHCLSVWSVWFVMNSYKWMNFIIQILQCLLNIQNFDKNYAWLIAMWCVVPFNSPITLGEMKRKVIQENFIAEKATSSIS